MREIVWDTETTGIMPGDGHRIVEIGALEMVNRTLTGRSFHTYIDPQRPMPKDAERVHGLSTDFLTGQPIFEQVVDDFLEFIGDAPLVAHNAAFDMEFLNWELKRAGLWHQAQREARAGRNASITIPSARPGWLRSFTWCGGSPDDPPGWVMLEAPAPQVIASVALFHATTARPTPLH